MKYFFIAIAFFLFQKAKAQSFTVSNLKENIVYVGLPNPIKATVENTDDRDVLLTSRDATLTKQEDGTYELMISKTGKLEVVVWRKNKKGKFDSLGISVFRGKPIPDPEAFVSGIHFGEISKNVLTVNSGVLVQLNNMDICARFKVISFNCIIIYKNGNTKLFPANNALFTDNMKMEFSFLQPGEQVVFCNIKCVGPDGKERKLEPIELTVVK